VQVAGAELNLLMLWPFLMANRLRQIPRPVVEDTAGMQDARHDTTSRAGSYDGGRYVKQLLILPVSLTS
jgi:phage gp36-like protein